MNKLCDFYNKESNTCDIDNLTVTCMGFMSKETSCLFCEKDLNFARLRHAIMNLDMNEALKNIDIKENLGEKREMCQLIEITCPECGGKLEVFWDRDCGTSVIACSNEECKFKTEIGNKEINSAFYMQYYNKMKYKEDLQKEMELRHG